MIEQWEYRENNIMYHQLELVILDTPEKFYPMKDQIVIPLLKLLKELSILETEFYERDKKLNEEKRKKGIPKNQTAPGSEELWQEYRKRYGFLVKPKCSEKLLQRGYARSFGKPAEYDYLNTIGCKIIFTMKSTKKAAVETFFKKGTAMKHQFIIKNMEDDWKIDKISYGFLNETTWHTYHI